MSSMRYTERPNNTPEQIREYLAEALAVVDELQPPEDLRVACFTKAAELASGKQILGEAIHPAAVDLGRLTGRG